MKSLATYLGIMTAVLAVVAAALSVVLFERRNEFRGRADCLAEAVSDMAQRIDQGSGTAFSDELTFTRADQNHPEQGTLSWRSYHDSRGPEGNYADFEKRLTQACQAAETLNEQRSNLAESLANIATVLETAENAPESATLRSLAKPQASAHAASDVVRLAQSVRERDDRMIRTLASCAQSAGVPLDVNSALRQRAQTVTEDGVTALGDYPAAEPLTALARGVAETRKRSDTFASTLEALTVAVPEHTWDTNLELLSNGQHYGIATEALLEDARAINRKLVLYRAEQKRARELELRVTEMAEELDAKQHELELARDTALDQAKEIAQLKQEVVDLKGIRTADLNPAAASLQGEVLRVAPDWEFVVLDLGKKQVRKAMCMLVARNSDLVAKVRISQVHENICIAEILPEAKVTDIEVGDRVILPYGTKVKDEG